MTTDLTIQNLFEGKSIRVLEQRGDIWIPLADITTAWGIDRSTPDNIINRNERVFEGLFSLVLDVTSNTAVSCLNERGLYLMMGKISAGRLKNEQAQEAIIKFQKWFPQLIQKYRKKEIVQVPKGPDYAGIIERMKFVRAVHEETGWNLLELQKEVLREAGMISLTYHIEPAQKVIIPPYDPKDGDGFASTPLPALPKPKSYLTASDIGERTGKTAYEVHMFLYQYKPPILIKDGHSGEWRLTPFGREFGEERTFDATKGNIKWWIAWNKGVLRLFNVFEHEEMG